jgi:peroxiredoxin
MQQQCAALCRLPALLRASGRASGVRAFASQAATAPPAQKYDSYSVPAGHQNSDLDSVACNISLNRRRDLTLRQDLHVIEDGKKATIADVMRGQLVAMFGVPDMGKVCTEKHLPDFLKNAEKLRKCGVEKIACAAVAPSAQLEEWAKKAGISGQISLIADEDGAMTRMLGLDLPATGKTDAGGPRSQRYVALVDSGILLKLKVEANMAEVKESSAESVMKILQTLKR